MVELLFGKSTGPRRSASRNSWRTDQKLGGSGRSYSGRALGRNRNRERLSTFAHQTKILRAFLVFNGAIRLVSRADSTKPIPSPLFSNTELAKDATEKILGIVAADDVTDSIESISELNRNELG